MKLKLMAAVVAGAIACGAQAEFVRTETAITTGVTRVTLVDEAKVQRAWMVKADMKTPGFRFLHHFSNGRIYNKCAVSAHASQIKGEGRYEPIAGVNGDFFGYDKGITQRLAVSDGSKIQTGYDPNIDSWSHSRLYQSPDGSFHWGDIDFHGSVTLGGADYKIQRMNSYRDAAPASGVGLFTYEYDWTMPGNGILIEFTDALAAGGSAAVDGKSFTIVGTVSSGATLDHTNPKRAAIVGYGSDAGAVAAATGTGSATWCFKNGSTVVDVRDLVGVWLTILNNGSIVPSGDQNETKDYPRTCIGLNAETGLFILFIVDGRQAGWSKRMSSAEVAQILIDEGCTWGGQFDGGGSTTMWDMKGGVLNRPSDGSERSVATSLFLVAGEVEEEEEEGGEGEEGEDEEEEDPIPMDSVPTFSPESFTYDGKNQAVTFSSLEHVVVVGVTNATEVGVYEFSLTPETGYVWPNMSKGATNFSWQITQAANDWATVPAISAPVFSSTQAAGVTITAGVPKFGTAAATISKDGGEFAPFGGAVPTEAGSYVLKYTVAATANWKSLEQEIAFQIMPFDINLGSNSFYNLLETNALRVGSSPYATGGDYVLKFSETEYAHVFKQGIANFTPNADLSGRVLLIGGGGAGGGNNNYIDGGGGGGGFVETNNIAFVADEPCLVAVAKGGSGTNGGSGGNGGATELVFGGVVEGQVEYVQATENVRFDTGYMPYCNGRIEVSFMLDELTGDAAIFCARNNYNTWGTAHSYALFAAYNNGAPYWKFDYVNSFGSNKGTGPAIETGVRYSVVAYGGDAYVNGMGIEPRSLSSSGTDHNLTLFYSYSDALTSNTKDYMRGRIYSCRVFSSQNVLMVDLVPYVKDGVAGFYDKVSKSFKKPSMGTLTAGPQVSGLAYVEPVIAYGGGGGGGKTNSGLSGASGGGGANSATAAGGAAIYGDQGFAGGDGNTTGGGGGGGAGGPGGRTGANTSDPKYSLGCGGPGRASTILGFEQYFGGGGGGCKSGNEKDFEGGIGGGHYGGGKGGISGNQEYYAGQDGLGGGGGACGNPSNSGCSGRGGSGLVVIRYGVSVGGCPALGDCTLSNAGGSALTLAGQVANAGSSEATVKIKLWPKAGEEDGEGSVVSEVATIAAGAAYADFEGLVAGLAFDTVYSYKYWAENAAGDSSVVTGEITTFTMTMTPTAVLSDQTPVVPTVDGFNSVYTFTADGTLTIPQGQQALVKVLVVGGGGAGGSSGSGGGGAGGVKYVPNYFLRGGTYSITVGAGGRHASSGGNNAAVCGKGSSFADISVSGGGGGANPKMLSNQAYQGNSAGASSAGACPFGNDRYSQKGIAGQGNVGGDGININGGGINSSGYGYSGGGGGAGTAGASANVEGAGDGGDGYPCKITGELLYYGAGGGGGMCVTTEHKAGKGGLGGGGDAGVVGTFDGVLVKEAHGESGSFYGAGGGAGSVSYRNNDPGQAYGGDGYQGVVIVSITDYSLAGGSPILEVGDPTDLTVNSVTIPVSVPSAGGGATVSLTAYWGYEEGDYSQGSRVLSEQLIGERSFMLDGLSPSRTYYLKLVADNGTGGDDATAEATLSFSTQSGMVPEIGGIEHTQAGYRFRYTIDALGDGENELRLYVSSTPSGLDTVEPMTVYTDLSVGSSQVIEGLLDPTDGDFEFGKTYYCRLALVNTYGDGYETVINTSTGEFVLTDNATYTWKGETGDWDDPTKWTCSVDDSVENGYSLGYPAYGANARFADDMTTTVRVTKAERVANISWNYQNAYIYLLGTSADAKIVPDNAGPGTGGTTQLGANSTFVFDGVKVYAPMWAYGDIPAGTKVVLRNGGYFAFSRYPSSWEWSQMIAAGASTTVESGAKFEVGRFDMANGAEMNVDGGTVVINNGTLDLAKSGTSAAVLRIGGAGSKVSATGAITASANPATISYFLPLDGYATAPLTGTKLAESGRPITFDAIKRDAPIRKGSKTIDFPVANFSQGINTNNIVFGQSVNGQSYFFFTNIVNGVVKDIWYHYRGEGMSVIVR